MLKYFLIFIIYCSSNELLGQKIIHTEWEDDTENTIFKRWEMKKLLVKDWGLKLVPIKCEIFEGYVDLPLTHVKTIEYFVNDDGRSFPQKVSFIDENGKVEKSLKTMVGDSCEYLIEWSGRNDKNKWITLIDTLRSSELYQGHDRGVKWDYFREDCY